MPQRSTHDCNRHGSKDLFTALDIASGKVITHLTDRHRAEEFIAFLELIDQETPKDLHVHIVLDNVATHNTEEVQKWRVAHKKRFTFYFTPTYSSQMNQVERRFSELTTKWIRRGTHRSIEELTESIQYWVDNRN